MFGEQAGHDHPHAVVHPAGGPQLAHAGIDDGNARLAALPCAQIVGVVVRPAPGKPAEPVAVQRLLGGLREVIEQVVGKLAPAQLPNEVRGLPTDRTPRLDGRQRLLRADLAKVQVR